MMPIWSFADSYEMDINKLIVLEKRLGYEKLV